MKKTCTKCKKEMVEGYCVKGGEEYYCDDKCLYSVMTEEEWCDLYEDGGESYWTQWEY